MFNIFFYENRTVYTVMWKMQQRQYGACALHAGYLRLQKTHLEYVILIAFSTATMVERKRLDVRLHVPRTLPVLFVCWWLVQVQAVREADPVSKQCYQMLANRTPKTRQLMTLGATLVRQCVKKMANMLHGLACDALNFRSNLADCISFQTMQTACF